MRVLVLLSSLLLLVSLALAQQSDNHALHAVPTPGKVVVDGKLDDWDLSGQFEVFANYRMKNTYSTKVAAMYDKENFYLAIVWRDPTPLYNMVDARFDIGSGWKSDCLQLRFRTDMTLHADCWYSTAAERAVINIAYGRWSAGRDTVEDAGLFEQIADAMKVGALEGFQQGADGKSYTQEIALPWRLITGQGAKVKANGMMYKAPKTYGPGDTFSMGMEFLWGGPDGKTWPVHRYADLLKEGTSSREFFWTAENSWGPVTLEPKGHLKLPAPDYGDTAKFLQKTDGPVALKYTMPADGFVTLVIEDAQGRRVKNLVGMAPRSKGKQVDYWDGTDEHGKLVPVGKYRWRGLTHQGIDPAYEASFGTPGTPPWDTSDGSGAWMSDHVAPCAVAAGKDMVMLGAGGSEAGWALIGVDLNGHKKWGERKFQGIRALAVDDTYVYCGLDAASWLDRAAPAVGRAEWKTGKYAPFATDPTPELIVSVASGEEKASLSGIAVTSDRLAVALSGVNLVRIFDKQTMKQLGEVAVAKPGGLTYDKAGTLYAISGTSIVKIAGGKVMPFIATNLGEPCDLTLDAAGSLYVTDRGSQQIKVFSADGTFARALGVANGRPMPGKWEPNGLRNPYGIDIDAQGRLWVAEETMFPKRISLWSTDGTLIKDFIGPTTYGGMGAIADPADKTRIFGNGCEFKLDYEKNQATVTANLLNDNLVGDLMKIQGREYYMSKRNELYLRKGDAFVQVACFGTMRKQELAKSTLPITLPAEVKDSFCYLWSDLNDDGAMQADEFAVTTKVGLDTGYWGGHWLDEQFNLYSGPGGYDRQPVSKVSLAKFTPGGAPVWDLNNVKTIINRESTGPNKLYLASGGQVIVGAPVTGIRDDGTVLWSYKDNWSDVHGSHNAPIPERDDTFVGLLSCIGKADTGGPLGKVFALNSNMGRLYVMTTDGLLVATVFQDCRIGSDPWPSEAKRGAPMGGVTMGGEWFGGYFFKAEKSNEYYLVAGGTSYNLIKLNGFETLKPLTGEAFNFTGKELQAAERLQQQKAAAQAAAKTLSIGTLPNAPKVDGKLDEFAKDTFVEWAAGQYRARAAMAISGDQLCLAYEVWGDNNPMVNGGKDVTQLFTTGDSVDLQLATDAAANAKRGDAVPGDLRLLITVLEDKPVAVLYRFKVNGEKHPVTFSSGWRKYAVDDVQVVGDAVINIARRGGGYTVEATVPLAALNFAPQAGKAYKLDLGVIFSDPTGTNRAARMYWSNKATGLVSDVPGEIMPSPQLWGTGKLAE